MNFNDKYPHSLNQTDPVIRVPPGVPGEFTCVRCGAKTRWVLIPLWAATCSEECMYAQVAGFQKSTHEGHWLLDETHQRAEREN